MRRYIVEKTSHCKNISVYGFDNEDWISADLDNYADDVHYKTSVNRYIITSINEGRHKHTTLNISEYEKIMLDKINDYKSVFDSQLKEMENIKQP